MVLARAVARGPWDVNVQLLLKLIGTSMASGLERLSIVARLAELEERDRAGRCAPPTMACGISISRATSSTSRRAGRRCWATRTPGPTGVIDWRSLVHPDDMSRVQDAIRNHVSGTAPMFESVHRMRHRNGE